MILPSWRDPRLHAAVVVIALQVLGQTVLAFPVSVAQILVAVGTCALLEVAFTFRRERALVWPASALLTGNSVAFILRVAGTSPGDWWSLNGWWIFAGTAAVSLLSKYVIRIGNRHLFNPSNFGLVLCFLIFGSRLTNPQDLWWGPMSPALVLTLALTVIGGLFVVTELRMLAMVATFWATFAVFVGAITVNGHCITARWHFGPVCGGSFWWLLVTSPEILVFIFFMITDPKTAPTDRVGRLAYGAAVAFAGALLLAPWRTEFGTKVGLLAGLFVVCALQPLVARVVKYWPGRMAGRAALVSTVGAVAMVSLVALSGLGAKNAAAFVRLPVTGLQPAVARPAIMVDPTAVPPVAISSRVTHLDPSFTSAQAHAIVVDLVADLIIVGDAAQHLDGRLASSAEAGPALDSVTRAFSTARSGGRTVVSTYHLNGATIVLAADPNAPQDPPVVAVRLSGRVHRATAATSNGTMISQDDAAYAAVLQPVLIGGHYLILDDVTAWTIN